MYRLIDNIPVWGEHDDSTLAQIRRCSSDDQVGGAALMADGHKGYSMPIGGVVAYREAVSPSGVGYDIACLAPGAPVTTRDGYYLPIEEIGPDAAAMCWDGVRTRPIDQNYGAVARGVRRVWKVVLSNGRTIQATSDHRILTEDGWKAVGMLLPQESVAVSPFVGLPFTNQARVLPIELSDGRLAAELAAREIYPVSTSSVLFPVLVRLLGYVSGDGHLSKDGKRVSIYTTSEHDAADLISDLARLGYQAHVHRRSRAPGRPDEIHVYVGSRAFHSLLAALGSPVGKKVWAEDPFPWLFESPRWVRAHFLSAFCSAEMMTPRIHPNGMIPNPQLKQAGENRNAINFIARLFRSLGFDVSVAASGVARGERHDAVLQILGGVAAQLRFVEEVGFCYAHEKRVAAAKIASIAWQRDRLITERTAAQHLARELRVSGASGKHAIQEVTTQYGVTASFVLHAMYGRRGTPRRSPGTAGTPNTTGEICWVPVLAVMEGDSVPVWDVLTSDPAHAFFASGVVVHNCGLKGVRTDLRAEDVKPRIPTIMDDISRKVVFGIGRTSGKNIDHPLFDDPTWRDIREVGKLKGLAQQQLGTVGSGNHFVDVLEDEDGWLWVSAHFGSRGLGHKTASGFLNLAAGRAFDDRAPGESMDHPATVLSLHSDLGQAYMQAMELAGKYAYAGRDFVVGQVIEILGATSTEEVHNHHNFSWREVHNGEVFYVVRKGATPAWPGERGFVGGSMGDISVVVEGVDTEEARRALRSTVHGAGRVMSRRRAAGKVRWKKDASGRRVSEVVSPGEVSREMMTEWLRREGVELRGAGTDESPHVYRRLPEVLMAHAGSIRVVHTLRPLGVVMAGADVFDPYKD